MKPSKKMKLILIIFITILFGINNASSQIDFLDKDYDETFKVYSLITDCDNVIWCSTNRGIFYYNGKYFCKFTSNIFNNEGFVFLTAYKNKIVLFNYTNTFYIIEKSSNSQLNIRESIIDSKVSNGTFYTYISILNDTLYLQQLNSNKLLFFNLKDTMRLNFEKIDYSTSSKFVLNNINSENIIFLKDNNVLIKKSKYYYDTLLKIKNDTKPIRNFNNSTKGQIILINDDSLKLCQFTNDKINIINRFRIPERTKSLLTKNDKYGTWILNETNVMLISNGELIIFKLSKVRSLTTDSFDNLFYVDSSSRVIRINHLSSIIQEYLKSNKNSRITESVSLNEERYKSRKTLMPNSKSNLFYYSLNKNKLKIEIHSSYWLKVKNDVYSNQRGLMEKNNNQIIIREDVKKIYRLDDSTLLLSSTLHPILVKFKSRSIKIDIIKIDGILKQYLIDGTNIYLLMENNIYEVNYEDNKVKCIYNSKKFIKNFYLKNDTLLILFNNNEINALTKNRIFYVNDFYKSIEKDVNQLFYKSNTIFIFSRENIFVENLITKNRYNLELEYSKKPIIDIEYNTDKLTIFSDSIVDSYFKVKKGSLLYSNSKIFFKDFYLNKTPLSLKDSIIKLPPSNNAFLFMIKPLVFYDKNKSFLMQYFLKKDNVEISSGIFRNNEFVSILIEGSGNYSISFKITDSSNSYLVKSISIFIDKPYYKTLAFFIFCIIVVSFLVFLITVIFLKNKHKKREFYLIYEKEILKAQSTSLYALMNPHFIFNTLNTLAYTISLDIFNSNRLIGLFSNLIRRNLEESMDQFIKLSNEIERIKIYVEIENFRFSNGISLHIDVKNLELLEFFIPSFILQPLVENAIIHGIFKKGDSGSINLIAYSNNNNLFLNLLDNGIGYQPSKQIENKGHKSIAVNAIKQRLYSMSKIYKMEFNISIERIEELGEIKGTIVKIVLPIFKNKPL